MSQNILFAFIYYGLIHYGFLFPVLTGVEYTLTCVPLYKCVFLVLLWIFFFCLFSSIPIYFICLYVVMYVHISCVCYTHMYIKDRGRCLLLVLCSTLFETGPFIELELADLARIISHLVSGILLSLLPEHQNICMFHCSFLCDAGEFEFTTFYLL